MFDLPVSTEIRKPLHKKLIYSRFAQELAGDKKTAFEEDISRIYIVNELSPTSLNVREGENVKSIFVVLIELKKAEYLQRNISLIAKLFGQNLIIALHHENKYQLSVYKTKLLYSDWQLEEDIHLSIAGLDLDNIWDNLVSQISGIVADDGNTLEEQIGLETEKDKIRKQIKDLEAKARKEQQAKKKFELFQEIKKIQNKLEGM